VVKTRETKGESGERGHGFTISVQYSTPQKLSPCYNIFSATNNVLEVLNFFLKAPENKLSSHGLHKTDYWNGSPLVISITSCMDGTDDLHVTAAAFYSYLQLSISASPFSFYNSSKTCSPTPLLRQSWSKFQSGWLL
jgi:hypothetical protein